MPTLQTPHARFLHLPKTGGTWVTRALAAGGVPTTRLPTRNELGPTIHGTLDDLPDDGVFTFAFVRHPLDWWRSVWVHRMRYGWNDVSPAERSLRSDDFSEFIRRVIERAPGHATRVFERFVGPANAQISFVGRYESLADDLVYALRLAGEPHDAAALRGTPPTNVGHYQKVTAEYSRELADALVDAERPIVDRFYADDPFPEQLLASPERRGRRAAPRAWYTGRARLRRLRAG
jgi:hypothetical protein